LANIEDPVDVFFFAGFAFIPGAVLTLIAYGKIFVFKKDCRPRWMLFLSLVFIAVFLIELTFDIVPVSRTKGQRVFLAWSRNDIRSFGHLLPVLGEGRITSDAFREAIQIKNHDEGIRKKNKYGLNRDVVGKDEAHLSNSTIILFDARKDGSIGSVEDLIEFRHGNQDKAVVLLAGTNEGGVDLHRRHWEALQCISRDDTVGLRKLLDDDRVPYWYPWMALLPKSHFLCYQAFYPRFELSYWLIPPLHKAIKQEKPEIMELLISHGIGLCAEFDGNTPLTLLSKTGKPEYLKMLVEKGARLIDKTDREEVTLLFEAAARGLSEVVELLIKKGAEVNFRESGWKKTPLHAAALKPRTRNDGWAASGARIHSPSHLDVAKLLVKNGAHINARDIRGNTPLHYAAERWDWEMVTFLIKNGAEVNAIANKDSRIPGNRGYTPLDVLAETASDSYDYDKRQIHFDFEKTRDVLLQNGGVLNSPHTKSSFDAVRRS
jgi:ankyrin repeat protein